jgi:hypothetical protein
VFSPAIHVTNFFKIRSCSANTISIDGLCGFFRRRPADYSHCGIACIDEHSITVQTKTKDRVTVYTMPETRYEKRGAVAAMTGLKVGNRW